MKNSFYIFLTALIFFQCAEKEKLNSIPAQLSIISKSNFDDELVKEWWQKDIIDDSIPGVSLEKAYELLLKNKKGNKVIVAVLDMPIDIDHEDLVKNIWNNTKEIPDNNIDDDNNGYVDDVNGWNFLGNKNGKNNKFVNYESTRVIKKYDSLFKNKLIKKKDTLYDLYTKAKSRHEQRLIKAKEDTAYINMVSNSKKAAATLLSSYFGKEKYSLTKLDSLKKLHPADSLLQEKILIMSNFMKYRFTDDYIKDYQLKAQERIDKLLNVDYNDRAITGDNSGNLEDIGYGNNFINNNLGFFDHGTSMSGLIAGHRKNGKGVKGVSDNILIMPLCVSAYGNEHDKDIALAIKYAVDNGAKVINMSIGKEFSLYKEWVFDAFRYAEKNDVIIISAAGNSKYDLDEFNDYYPNDNVNNKEEVTSNFVKVGASTYKFSKKLAAKFSNYGKYDVDFFAPGSKIFTTTSNEEKYKFVSGGTSLSSAITSGIAALIRSYYPDLSALEIKNILIESGVSYNIDVEIKQENGTKKLVPFSELSKSGKIVNAYNALLMAEEVSKRK